ncbi:MAG: hypothetical protein J6Y78_09835 [Paludibacteraceae bacterium]|nr:hypothetical protein [Paludibacteraceae bacterium]
MKKIFYVVVMLLMGAVASLQAQNIQEEDELPDVSLNLFVNYKGQKPVITDFMTAILSQEDIAGTFRQMADDWKKYQKGQPLDKNRSFIVDTKNGFVRYDLVESNEESVYIEFCYWNCADGKHKLIASNFVLIMNGSPVDTELTGQSFYLYDNTTKELVYTYPVKVGAQLDRPDDCTGVICNLPRVGKSIEYILYSGKKTTKKRITWNGSKFVKE